MLPFQDGSEAQEFKLQKIKLITNYNKKPVAQKHDDLFQDTGTIQVQFSSVENSVMSAYESQHAKLLSAQFWSLIPSAHQIFPMNQLLK